MFEIDILYIYKMEGTMMDWIEEMYRRARKDDWHQFCLQRVYETEGAFRTIRDALDPQQQEELDEYIHACEELERSLIYIVRQMG